jgi:trk system potassium uptake protein TrkH
VLSLAEIAVLMVLGMGPFDAVTHTFSTVSTGGFSPHADSVARYSHPVRLAITFFMVASGLNFSHYYTIVRRRDLTAFRDVELRAYLLLTLGTTALVAISLAGDTWLPSLVQMSDALFQVVSILTTTGFATADFNLWPDPARALLVAVMVIGGCAGSTAGGVKVSRVVIAWRAAVREIRLTYGPNSVIAVALGKDSVPEESVRSVVALFFLWVGAWGIGSLLLTIGGIDMTTASTAAIATLSNVGPGLGLVGPTGDFAFFASWQKVVMIFLMWLGRLEFFALLAVMTRRFWAR